MGVKADDQASVGTSRVSTAPSISVPARSALYKALARPPPDKYIGISVGAEVVSVDAVPEPSKIPVYVEPLPLSSMGMNDEFTLSGRSRLQSGLEGDDADFEDLFADPPASDTVAAEAVTVPFFDQDGFANISGSDTAVDFNSLPASSVDIPGGGDLGMCSRPVTGKSVVVPTLGRASNSVSEVNVLGNLSPIVTDYAYVSANTVDPVQQAKIFRVVKSEPYLLARNPKISGNNIPQ